MSRARAILARLAAGRRADARTMIVVAHPDDETIAMGGQLGRLDDALLVHLTDGAPRDGADARAHGFAAIADYAAARRAELAAALRAGDAARLRTLALDIPDKEAVRDLAGLAHRLAALLRAEQPAAVFTHAYEGGHPDHDAGAFAVRAACRLADESLAVIEMPLYHRRNGRLVTGKFLRTPTASPSPQHSPRKRGEGDRRQPSRLGKDGVVGGSCIIPSPRKRGEGQGEGLAISLAEQDRRRKQRMIECFATQRWLLAQFDTGVERFRIAPDYDFRQPPHLGELHYETLGWGIAGAAWRQAAAAALDRLGLSPDRHCEERSDEAIPRGASARLLRAARNDD